MRIIALGACALALSGCQSIESEIDAAMRAAMRPEGTCERQSGGLECQLILGRSTLELTRSEAFVVANLRELGPDDPDFEPLQPSFLERLQPTFLAFWVKLGFTEHDVRSCLRARGKLTIPKFMLACDQKRGQWAGYAWGTNQFDLTRTPGEELTLRKPRPK
jgi:hypothetical protein